MRTRSTVLATVAAAGVTAAGAWQLTKLYSIDPGPEAATAARYEVDHRPLTLAGHLTNRDPRVDPPFGEHPLYRAGDAEFMYWVLDRGTDRVILRALGKSDVPGPVLFSSWQPLLEVQRDAFRDAVRRWKGENPRRQVGVYFFRSATAPFVRRTGGIAEGPRRTLDPQDPKALRWWHHNTAELLEFVDEVWLDAGSLSDDPDGQAAIIRLARFLRETTGVKLGVEAVAIKRGRDGRQQWDLGPDWEYHREVAGMALWRYVWHRWHRLGTQAVLEVPAELRDAVEVHVLLENPPPGRDYPPPTAEQVAELESFGWTISWLNGIFEPQPGTPDPKPEPAP